MKMSKVTMKKRKFSISILLFYFINQTSKGNMWVLGREKYFHLGGKASEQKRKIGYLTMCAL